MIPYRDRAEAGRHLATLLTPYARRPDALALALPRGGVPVAFEVAAALQVPLDVFLVRKLGVPGREELAMGALAGGGVRVINDDVVRALQVTPAVIEQVAEEERRELERRERLYRDGRPAPVLKDRLVILIDDGLATGATMRAAVGAARQWQPAGVIVAVPVAAEETCREMSGEVDEMVCAYTPEPFLAVGHWYQDFSQTTDSDVRELLARAAA